MRSYCVMFAGQSVQESGMGNDLLRLPAAKEALERLKPYLGPDLEQLLTTMGEEDLARTYNAQRAIHACHVANFLAYKAMHPELKLDGAIGHSMGVVAALVAAEALSVEDSGRFILARAQAFADCCKGLPEPMGLAAASTDDFGDVVEAVKEFPSLSIALYNTVGRGTIGGTLAALEAFKAKAQEEDWPVRLKILKVEGPYHTPAFASCVPVLEKALAAIELNAPKIPVFMGTSGKLETDPARIKKLLAEQAASTEWHLQAVRAAYAEGCRTFLETAYKPQPITWLCEQLVAEDGSPLPDVEGVAVRTEDLI